MTSPSFDERKLALEQQRLDLERQRDARNQSFLSRNFPTVTTALISLAAVAFSIFQYYGTRKRAQAESAAAEVRANRDFDMETYKVVVGSLTRHDSAEQFAALRLTALVNDTGVRQGLLEALGRSGAPVVRTEAKAQVQAERQFATEQSVLQAPPSGDSWRYDVFYCDDASSGLAQLADSVLGAIPRTGVTARKRPLPRSINLRQGYRIAGYEIRYEPSELQQAESLQRQLAPFSAPNRTFRLVPVSNRTPNYLSVFLCP